MIASSFPDIGFDFLVEPLSVVGVLLLLLYAWFRVRGRELLPRGPTIDVKIRIPEALLIYLGSFAAQVATAAAALGAGVPKGPLLVALSYVGPVLIALISWYAWFARRVERGPQLRGAIAGVLACLATMPVVAAVLVAWTRLFTAAGGTVEEQQVLTDLRGEWAVFFLVAVVFAPFTEEVIFRGLLQTALKRRMGAAFAFVMTAARFGEVSADSKRRMGVVLAVVMTATGFALVHWSPTVSPAIFVLGLALGYVYERTGTLAAPMTFHAAFNGMTFLGELMG